MLFFFLKKPFPDPLVSQEKIKKKKEAENGLEVELFCKAQASGGCFFLKKKISKFCFSAFLFFACDTGRGRCPSSSARSGRSPGEGVPSAPRHAGKGPISKAPVFYLWVPSPSPLSSPKKNPAGGRGPGWSTVLPSSPA